ncbi:MAG TPA: ArsA-related P-loop ATPase [Kofleriaceae bacterium]|nr:ArsA-related P-loop ATPase [Kofleriaceae bacterium]
MAAHRLHIVTGKGGVGKSTVAAALAIAAAARGARVLAIELGEIGGTCRILGATPPAPGAIVPAADGTHATYFDGVAALAEYLTQRLRLGRLVQSVIDHPLYAAFVDAAPGLRELMAVGKIRDEFVLQDRWDVVVVDAGASGHALEHLRMPATAAGTFTGGRVHREAEANATLLRDPSLCSIHVVTHPEEMPLREAVQTVGALRALDLATGAVFVNACVPTAPPDVDAAIAQVANRALAGFLAAQRRWEQIQEHGIAELERELFVRALRLPRLRAGSELARARALDPYLAEVAA